MSSQVLELELDVASGDEDGQHDAQEHRAQKGEQAGLWAAADGPASGREERHYCDEFYCREKEQGGAIGVKA